MNNSMRIDFWIGVPLRAQSEWNAAFSHDPSKIRVGVPCPLCNRVELFRWYDGACGLWQWCNDCGAYEHSTVMPPVEWLPEVSVVPKQLTALPSSIVEALCAVHFL